MLPSKIVKLVKLVCISLTTSIHFNGIGFDYCVGTYKCLSGHDVVRHTPKIFPFLPQRRDKLQVCPQLRIVLAQSHSLRSATNHSFLQTIDSNFFGLESFDVNW